MFYTMETRLDKANKQEIQTKTLVCVQNGSQRSRDNPQLTTSPGTAWVCSVVVAKEDSLENEQSRSCPSADSSQLKTAIEVDPLKSTCEVARTFNVGVQHSFYIWSKVGGKKGCKWRPYELIKNKNEIISPIIFSCSTWQQWSISISMQQGSENVV